MSTVKKPRNHVFLAMRKTRTGGEHQKALKPGRARLRQSMRKELDLQEYAEKPGRSKDVWPCTLKVRVHRQMSLYAPDAVVVELVDTPS